MDHKTLIIFFRCIISHVIQKAATSAPRLYIIYARGAYMFSRHEKKKNVVSSMWSTRAEMVVAFVSFCLYMRFENGMTVSSQGGYVQKVETHQCSFDVRTPSMDLLTLYIEITEPVFFPVANKVFYNLLWIRELKECMRNISTRIESKPFDFKQRQVSLNYIYF